MEERNPRFTENRYEMLCVLNIESYPLDITTNYIDTLKITVDVAELLSKTEYGKPLGENRLF